MFFKKVNLKSCTKYREKHLEEGSLTQVFWCEFCEIFQIGFFTEQLQATTLAVPGLDANR